MKSQELRDFANNEKTLKSRTPDVLRMREETGLEGLVGGLESVIINTEPDRQQPTVEELLRYTGYDVDETFEDNDFVSCALKSPGSADFLVRSRKRGENPFTGVNKAVATGHLPNTRLETFVFRCPNLERYVSIQRSNGLRFLTDDIQDNGSFLFIQTPPSEFTGNSIGFIQWKEDRGRYRSAHSEELQWPLTKPRFAHLRKIGRLDHAATRIKAKDRAEAILEFLRLTNYRYKFAIYVESMNSITSVTRLSPEDFALVFTSGISPFVSEEESGPTERFVHKYGRRLHHLAFHTEEITDTFQALKKDGMTFLLELVGSEEEGLRQTFSTASPHTLLVNEYIYRYGDFDGFFTKSNVTLLTEATGKQ